MTTEAKGLTDAWLVICNEGFDCAFSVREMANDHCNIMAAELPQMGPWRVRRFVDASGAASVPRDDEGLLMLLDNTSLMLRGMLLDPAIPEHAKAAMLNKITDLEDAIADRDDAAREGK